MTEGTPPIEDQDWQAPVKETKTNLTAAQKAQLLYPNYVPLPVDFIASNGVVVNIKTGIVKMPKNLAALGEGGLDRAADEYLRAYPLSEDESKG